TFDTKQHELLFVGNLIAAQNIRVNTVDLSTSGQQSMADVKPTDVADHHPAGVDAVFTGDRGSAEVVQGTTCVGDEPSSTHDRGSLVRRARRKLGLGLQPRTRSTERCARPGATRSPPGSRHPAGRDHHQFGDQRLDSLHPAIGPPPRPPRYDSNSRSSLAGRTKSRVGGRVSSRADRSGLESVALSAGSPNQPRPAVTV
ncbi:MAG: Tm-1-like ATP-binding domain-containing protein, partial [Acidobacteria bacterium]|nr:Tm-1-like ATP-binding domain-containing protein [Candidatus Sulfomarinibacter sp. MAG AM2]